MGPSGNLEEPTFSARTGAKGPRAWADIQDLVNNSYSYGRKYLPIINGEITGYFYGIIHSINGVT
jgi:hypothetical protein